MSHRAIMKGVYSADFPVSSLHFPDSVSWIVLPSASNFISTCSTPCDAGR